MDQKSLVEAALFISQKPLDLQDLARITGLSSLGFLKETIDQLTEDYRERGMEITCVDGRYHMQVRPDLLNAVASLTPHQDMPEGHKRTLALVVYKEPVKQSEIIRIQGTKAYSYIKKLKKSGLLKAERQGHTSILTTTKELENYFGMSKKDIKSQISIIDQPSEPEDS